MRVDEATVNRDARAAGNIALHTARARALPPNSLLRCDFCKRRSGSGAADSCGVRERYCRYVAFASCLADRTTKAMWRTTYDRPDDAAARIPRLVVKGLASPARHCRGDAPRERTNEPRPGLGAGRRTGR